MSCDGRKCKKIVNLTSQHLWNIFVLGSDNNTGTGVVSQGAKNAENSSRKLFVWLDIVDSHQSKINVIGAWEGHLSSKHFLGF